MEKNNEMIYYNLLNFSFFWKSELKYKSIFCRITNDNISNKGDNAYGRNANY